jgi:hypothetical protein
MATEEIDDLCTLRLSDIGASSFPLVEAQRVYDEYIYTCLCKRSTSSINRHIRGRPVLLSPGPGLHAPMSPLTYRCCVVVKASNSA